MMKNIIEVHNLKYKYDNDTEEYILNDVTFHVKHGEWLSIVGHNGSGKSTTIRLIDGLLEAESGEIIISRDQLTPENVWDGFSKSRQSICWSNCGRRCGFWIGKSGNGP